MVQSTCTMSAIERKCECLCVYHSTYPSSKVPLGSGGLVGALIYPAQVWRMRHLEALRATFHEGALLLYSIPRQGFQPS